MFAAVFCFPVMMERLVNELGSLLKMLDHETVSPATAEKMASIRNILDSMPLSGTSSSSLLLLFFFYFVQIILLVMFLKFAQLP